MVYKINEEFYIKEIKLKCIESANQNGCEQCYFYQNKMNCLNYARVAKCHPLFRSDQKSVHYINIK